MKKSIALVLLLLLCFHLDLPLVSPAHPSPPTPNLSHSPGGALRSRSAENLAVVERKGGGAGGGHGGRGGAGRGGGTTRLIPFYGGAGGARRSNGHRSSGSNRPFASVSLNAGILILSAVLLLVGV